MTAATGRSPLTIAEILALPAVVPLWPEVGRALGLAESTAYQLAAEGRLPIEVFTLGRRRMARTVDLHAFLGLAPLRATEAPAPAQQQGGPSRDCHPGTAL
ncbi:hypothetical protein RM572_00815 [Streptomyces sp. DSM 42041]|uniref:DNA-binding protein n=1 Tax=Streptomyces hazeniae TaxID=3075538 RepID=A0ABU2NLG8_9ACTN|nr:hypothetical protein [Streptomyces sp. DSM 42041]MDT0377317.1 hypothetical protein [Streptomyces sp. DSM 42041]